MGHTNKIILLLLFISLSSFKIRTENIIGIWSYQSEKFAYSKYRKMPKGPCIVFKKSGKLIVRQNAGWCGTPPIIYANFKGTWKRTSDSTILLQYKDWRGLTKTEWRVTALSKKWLKMKPLDRKADSD